MIKLVCTPEVPRGDVLPSTLIAAIRELHAQVPIALVLVELKDAATRKYLYRITTDEPTPRNWRQNLYVAAPVSSMTFDVTDMWKESEFIPHRKVRDTVLTLLKKYPVLERIRYDGV